MALCGSIVYVALCSSMYEAGGGEGGGRRTGGGLTGDWAVENGHWPHTELRVYYTGEPYTSISMHF